jgi:hypothetical protein
MSGLVCMRARRRSVAPAWLLSAGIAVFGGSAAAGSCTDNPVACENRNSGSTGWQISAGATYDEQVLSGYGSAPSVERGQVLLLYVRAPGPYTIDIYRLGYYQGSGGRLLDTRSQQSGQAQPACRWLQSGSADEYYSCDNWGSPVAYAVSASWVSGVYFAVLTAKSGAATYQYHIPFVVRDDGRKADFLYQQAVATDQAYNAFTDGNFRPPSPSFPLSMSNTSLYSVGHLANYQYKTNVVYKASFDRPFARIDLTGLYRFELPFIQWLEQHGYDAVYATDLDTHATHETAANYKAMLFAGHSEYWSKAMYDAVLNARNAGVSLGFFSGDTLYWQARFEPNVAGVADRVMVCFRRPNPKFAQTGSTQVPPTAADPSTDPTTQTIYWRDPPVSRDEQTLVGLHKPNPYTHPPPVLGWVSFFNGSLVIHEPQPMIVQSHDNWVYRGTGLQEGAAIPSVYGQEADAFEIRPTRPPAGQTFFFLDPPFQPPQARTGTFVILADSVFQIPNAPVNPTVNTTIYQACSGAWVFAAGSIMWGNTLSPTPPIGGSAYTRTAGSLITKSYVNKDVQRMTANLLNAFNGSDPPAPAGACPAVAIATGLAIQ